MSLCNVMQVARHPDCVTVVTGIVGCAGLKVYFFMINTAQK